MLQLISWNINQRPAAWSEFATSEVDVAMLQEATPPPAETASQFEIDVAPPWQTGGAGLRRPWRAAIARVSERVEMRPCSLQAIDEAEPGQLAVSRTGTLAVAEVTVRATGETITVVSMYGAWESPVAEAGSSWIYADASVHRLISDLSALIGRQKGHRIIAAGDLNILRGYGEDGSPYWRDRYQTVFDRMEALGLPFVGPALPDGGVPPIVQPKELPDDSASVPTFRTRQPDPASATRQLDFVFASTVLVPRMTVRALNTPAEWGPSDHCRVMIELR